MPACLSLLRKLLSSGLPESPIHMLQLSLGDNQLFRGNWNLHWGNNSPRPQDHRALALPSHWITPDFLYPNGSASWLPCSQWLRLSIQYQDGEWLLPWLWEVAWQNSPPPSDFQDMSQNPSLRVVPMTRSFPTQLPISEGDQSCLTRFIQGQDICLTLCPEHKNFKQVEGATSAKDCNGLTEGCGMWFTNKKLAGSHIWVAHSHMGLSASGLGYMAAAHVPIPFRTGKHSKKHLGNVHGAGLDTSYGCEHLGV